LGIVFQSFDKRKAQQNRMKRKSNNLVGAIALRWKSGVLSSFLFIMLSAILLFSSAVQPQNFKDFRVGAMDLLAPVIAVVNAPVEAAASYISMVSGLTTMQAENAALRAENQKLREWYMAAMSLQTKNAALADVLNVEISDKASFISTRVMQDQRNAFMHSVLVDAGKQSGVSENQAVMNKDGVIGRVLEVGERTARVLLLSDINSRIPVLIQNGDAVVKAILAGNNKSQPHFVHMPDSVSLKAGAHVMTSGDGGVYPYGLAVGTVLQNKKGGYDMQPYADMNQIHFVRIVEPEVKVSDEIYQAR